MEITDIYPTQQELNNLQALLGDAAFDEDGGRWVLPDGRAVPTCAGCPSSRPEVVVQEQYPDPHDAPPTTVTFYLCWYHATHP